VLRQPVGPVGLEHPLREAAEHPLVIDLLEGLASAQAARHLADEQDHRRRVLRGRVDADRGVRRPGPPRDEADARTPRQLPVGLGHVRRARLVPADDELDTRVAQGVEDGQVALPGDAEGDVDPVQLELVDEDAPAAADHSSSGASRKIVARWSFGFSSSAGSR
jgi:hypothetical protein